MRLIRILIFIDKYMFEFLFVLWLLPIYLILFYTLLQMEINIRFFDFWLPRFNKKHIGQFHNPWNIRWIPQPLQSSDKFWAKTKKTWTITLNFKSLPDKIKDHTMKIGLSSKLHATYHLSYSTEAKVKELAKNTIFSLFLMGMEVPSA